MKKLILIFFLSFTIGASAQDSENKFFLELVNAHRANHGLKPVEYSATLDSAVTLHVNWMVSADTLEHYQYPLTPDGIYYIGYLTRIEKFDQDWKKHFSRYSFRENVGAHYKISSNYNALKSVKVDKSTVTIIFNEWVKSAGHNAALLDPKVTVTAFDINGGYDTQKRRFSSYATCLFAVKL